MAVTHVQDKLSGYIFCAFIFLMFARSSCLKVHTVDDELLR